MRDFGLCGEKCRSDVCRFARDFTAYKDYKFMKIRSDSSLFEGRNFCYLDFVFDSVFAVFRYGTHACHLEISKTANLIKFADSPRTPCADKWRGVLNLA